jgi:hypothetical protein
VWLNENKNNNENKTKLSTTLVPVNLKFMCIMICLEYFLNADAWVQIHDLRFMVYGLHLFIYHQQSETPTDYILKN